MQRLGERIKKKRETLSLQLNTLADMVGVSSSCLSQIEKGKAFPSIVNLKRIADNLHTTVGELIGENETLIKNPIVKSNEKKFVKDNGVGLSVYLLSHHDQNKQMETYYLVFNENGKADDIMSRHPGQAFCYLIEGNIEFILDNKMYKLSKGDSLYFNSNIPHEVRNTADKKSEMIWIVTPPNI